MFGQLVNTVGPEMYPHLTMLIPPVAKCVLDKRWRDLALETLHQVEQSAGPDAYKCDINSCDLTD